MDILLTLRKVDFLMLYLRCLFTLRLLYVYVLRCLDDTASPGVGSCGSLLIIIKTETIGEMTGRENIMDLKPSFKVGLTNGLESKQHCPSMSLSTHFTYSKVRKHW